MEHNQQQNATIIETMKNLGPVITLNKGRRMLCWNPLAEQWTVTRGVGRTPRSVLYEGNSFEVAFQILLIGLKP